MIKDEVRMKGQFPGFGNKFITLSQFRDDSYFEVSWDLILPLKPEDLESSLIFNPMTGCLVVYNDGSYGFLSEAMTDQFWKNKMVSTRGG